MDGIKPSKEKACRIRNLKAPGTVKEVRQILGIVNYYGRYIPGLADLAEPMHRLLKKGVRWNWGIPEQKSLDSLKEAISRDESLAPFQTAGRCETRLTTDASELGLGAVLEQKQQNGIWKPVVYWSSKLRSYERNYSISEKEALACVTSMVRFRKYLLGRTFTLRTDHRALAALLSQGTTKVSQARTERWREKYRYSIIALNTLKVRKT